MVFDVGRVLTEPVEIAGYHLPAGVMVAPGIGLVHASAGLYPDPERFDPDRMVGATLSPTTWLPFGGGNRRCLGARFAMAEMRVVLREVLRRVELSTRPPRGSPAGSSRHYGTPAWRPDQGALAARGRHRGARGADPVPRSRPSQRLNRPTPCPSIRA